MSENLKSTGAGSTPIWDQAFDRYRTELSSSIHHGHIFNETNTMQGVLDDARTARDSLRGNESVFIYSERLPKTLNLVKDFVAVLAVFLGANVAATAVVWGSIRFILSLAFTARERLHDVLEMIEELSNTLPELRRYENTLDMTPALKESLLELYTEVICFYARTIQFFENNRNPGLRDQSWVLFRSDFKRTIQNIRTMTARVKEDAEYARMKMDSNRYKEVLDLVAALKESKMTRDENFPTCYTVPQDPNQYFFARDTVLQEIKDTLEPANEGTGLRSFAIHGMGGVGKTQVALQYAKLSRGSYDLTIWIAAESSYSIGQSARDSGKVLKLFTNETELQDIGGAPAKLRSWLTQTDRKWLLVLDNADDADNLRDIWPSGAHGSILLTSRDFAVASNPASAGYHLQPFDAATGATLLSRILNAGKQTDEDRELSIDIASSLGGLPLALNQIAGFIAQRKMRLKDFPSQYEKHSSRIAEKKSRYTSYERTLSDVWDLSLSKLPENAVYLHRLLAFFNPTAIDEAMLLSSSSAVTDEDFVFLSDDIDLGDAEVPLLQSSLIEKHIENQYLSVHRLVQQAVLQKTPKRERVKYADVAVQILQQMVQGSGSDVADFLKAWTEERWVLHENCLPHLLQLVRHCRQYDIRPSNIKAMIALLLPCEIFVREREMFDIAEELIQAGLWFVESDKNGLDYASLSYRLGLVKLYTHRLEEALGHFQEGLRLREGLLGPDHALVAWGYNNIGLTFTELGRQRDAIYYLQTALEKRRTHDPSCVGNSLSNLASLSLKMGLPDQAEQHLFSCPSLQGLTDDLLLEKNNPRFAGDMVLLSRIRRAQGRSDDALRLASKALAYRQKLLGNRFTACDSMHDVALLLIEHEKYETASSMLRELLSIAKSSLGHHGRGQLARACYRLSALHANLGETAVSQQYKDSAMDLARKLVPVGRPITFDEETFGSLCPWMLW